MALNPLGKMVGLYFGCEAHPGFMIRELGGKKTVGKFIGGHFCVVKKINDSACLEVSVFP